MQQQQGFKTKEVKVNYLDNFRSKGYSRIGDLTKTIPMLAPYNEELKQKREQEKTERLAQMYEIYNGRHSDFMRNDIYSNILKCSFAAGNLKRNFLAIPSNSNLQKFTSEKWKLKDRGFKILGLNSCKEKDDNPEIWNKSLAEFKVLNLTYNELEDYINYYHIGIAYNPEDKVLYLLVNSDVDSEKYPSEITKLIENNYNEVMAIH